MTTNLYPQRKNIRLGNFDYSNAGAYFITICTAYRRRIFGRVEDGSVVPSEAGQIVESCWIGIPHYFPHAELDDFVIMPNHVHGIIIIYGDDGKISDTATTVGRARHVSPLRNTPALGSMIGAFKSAVTRQMNTRHNTAGRQIWQRGYYEHIIRDEHDLNRVRAYILANPIRWMEKHDI